MARSITINTGEKVEIRNTDGETMGFFYFNPADPDIVRRCNEAQKKIGELADGIKERPTMEELETVNAGLREQMAFILGESAAKSLFEYNSPLAIMPDGQTYGVYAFHIIYEFIKTEVTERMEKSARIAENYTAKYGA